MFDLPGHDGLGLAGLLRADEVSPLELLDEALWRGEAVSPRLSAVVRLRAERAERAERARTEAASARQGPFAGVPFLLEDLLSTIADAPTSGGSRLWRGALAPRDGELVRRFRQAGLVCAGRSSCPAGGDHARDGARSRLHTTQPRRNRSRKRSS